MERLHSADPPIIHGDLKCGNLLFDENGRRVVIADFGLASSVRDNMGPNASGRQVALTVAISPPEVRACPPACLPAC
jgi:serine/threonine protein kinase